MKNLAFILVVASFFLTYSIYAADSFSFSGKIKCELSSTFVVFDFDVDFGQ